MTIPEIQARLKDIEARTRFHAGWHRYQVNTGDQWEVFKSVSSVKGCLKAEGLIYWSARVAEEEAKARLQAWLDSGGHGSPVDVVDGCRKAHTVRKKKAADLGTEVHALIEGYCKRLLGVTHTEPSVSDNAHFIFAEWLRWAQGVDMKVVAIEQRVFSLEQKVAGTLDLLAFINGHLTVLDWKTRKDEAAAAIYPDVVLQNVAYRRMLTENGIPESKGLILKLPRDGGLFEAVPLDSYDVEPAWEAFIGLNRAYPFVKAMEERYEAEREAKKKGVAA